MERVEIFVGDQGLTAAARQLGVDGTTVSRRIKALQMTADAQLVQRQQDGSLRLTASGEAVAKHAEAMQLSVNRIEETLGSARDSCIGLVRLTSVPLLINRLLAPCAASLVNTHPHLQIELVPDSRDFSLTRREADIAVRLARPKLGGQSVTAQRIGNLQYAAYAACNLPTEQARSLAWIGFEDAMAHLPQAQWISKIAKTAGDTVSGFKVHDSETGLEAAATGLGRTLLLCAIADRDVRLQRLHLASYPEMPLREVWLLSHNDRPQLRRVTEVINWVKAAVRETGNMPE